MLDTPRCVKETPPLVVRVIAGEFGGRRLVSPPGRDTRPTSDRVREAIFMALEPLEGLNVVDLFAGSGALGIEALSRGAVRVDFVEPGRAARRALEANLDALDLRARARIWPVRLPQGLKRLAAELEDADLVLLDPPYGGALARATLEALASTAMRGDARVIVEHHAKDELDAEVGVLAVVRQRRFGETMVTTYRVAAGRMPAGA